MLYAVSTDLEKSEILTWTKLHYSKKARRSQLSSIGLSAITEIMLLLAIFLLHKKDTTLIALAVCTPLIMVMEVFLPRIATAATWKRTRKVGHIEMSFSEAELTSQTKKGRFTYYYDGLDSIYHTDGLFIIYVDKQAALIIPERSFTLGDPESFRRFITQRTGLEIIEFGTKR